MTNAGAIALCKSGDFSSAYKIIGKNGKAFLLMLITLFNPLSIAEHQQVNLINQLDYEIVEIFFEPKHEENLRKQELNKENYLEKAQNVHIQNLLWHERFATLAWKSVTQVTIELRKINKNK